MKHTRPISPSLLGATLFATALLIGCGSDGTDGDMVPTASTELEIAAPADLGMSVEALDELTSTLQGYVEADRLAGGVAVVLRDGKVAYAQAVGSRDLESGDPMRTDALFRIASQSKAIISVAVMMLRDEGALALTDPVSRHLASWSATSVGAEVTDDGVQIEPADRAITIHDLLTHTAGIGYGYGAASQQWESAGIQGWYFAHLEEPVRSTIDRMAELPMDAQPGTRFVYGYNTDILGAVVEAASGMSLDAFVQERILDPLEMVDTHFYVPPEKRDRLAAVYNQNEDRTVARAPDGPGMQTQGQYVDGPRMSFSGGAGLVSTARDYARFLQMLLDGGSLGSVRILAEASVDEMTRNQSGALFTQQSPGMGFGLGFAIRMDAAAAGIPGSVGEFGWGGAYHSTYWVDPAEGLVVVYLTQLIPATGIDDHARVREQVYASIAESRRSQ